MKKNTKKQIINISFVILLLGIMLFTLSKSTDELNFTNLKEFLFNCRGGYLVVAFICWILFILFEALSLHIILKKLGCKPKFRDSIVYSTSDTYYSAITPSATGGQPASAYYMIKNGVPGGTAGFSLIFNLVGYTAAILIIGAVGLIFGYDTFIQLPSFVKLLIALGYVLQIFLLLFFIACMCYHKIVRKLGHAIVRLLTKIKIIRKKENWHNRVNNVVDKYRSCYEDFKKHKTTLIPVIICNVAQRSSQVLISSFVCRAAIDCGIGDIFILQSLVLLGYNSIPLPGGTVAYEFLYLKIFGLYYPEAFIVIAMMVTRAISYYFSLIASGIYTIIYHILHLRKKKDDLEVVIENNVVNQ